MRKIVTFALVLFSLVTLASCAKKTNKAPVISGVKDVSVEVGGTHNPLDGVTVKDEDADIQTKLKVFGWHNEYAKKAGKYEVVYYVVDSKGLKTVAASTVTVGDASQAPVITGVNMEQTHYQGGEDYNPFANVTAKNNAGTDISDEVELKNSNFDDTVEGLYGLTLYVEFEGVAATKVIVLKVQGDLPDELDPNQQITIEMQHAMGAANQALLKKYAASFKEIYPNVTVVIPDSAGNYDTLKNNTINNIASGDFPNLVQSYPDHVAEYLNSKVVLNLNPYIYSPKYGLNGDDALEDIVESYRLENTQYDEAGTYYSLPYNKSTEVLVYNKTAFEALDIDPSILATWEGVFEAAEKLKVYGEETLKNKQVVPVAYDSSGNGFISLSKQWGGNYTSINHSTGRGQYLWYQPGTGGNAGTGDAGTVAALEYFKQKSVKSDTNPNGEGLFTLPGYWAGQNYASVPFIAQQTFITIGSSAGVRHNMPENKDFVVDTAPVPYFEGMPENRQVIQQGTNVAILSKGNAQEDLAAWLFLKHIINTENTTDWAMNTGYVPVRESAFNSATYQAFLNKPISEQNGAALGAKATYPQRDFMFFDPAFPGSSRSRASVGGALERVILGDGNILGALKEAYDTSMVGQ